jgi:hypothetical protein
VDATRTLEPSDPGEQLVEMDVGYLVVAFDCARPTAPPLRIVLDGHEVFLQRGRERRVSNQEPGRKSVELADVWVSSTHARLFLGAATHPATWTIEDFDSKNGTLVNGRRIQRAGLHDRDVIEVGNTLLVYRNLRHAGAVGDLLGAVGDAPAGLPRTVNPAWGGELTTLLRLAPGTASVLLVGESGTGKEVLARFVHAASGRSGAFIAVNCGALANNIVESELFGARKGAYSGALDDRVGLVRASDGGTLFLDEVSELSASSQVALLRVLQEREVLPVGATRPTPVDLRVVAATNVDLARRVADGTYRTDLYARLTGHLITLPTLRERREDLGLLIGELLTRLAPQRAEDLTMARVAARALFTHDWPFNVRELEHVLRAWLAASDGPGELSMAQLPKSMLAGFDLGAGPPTLETKPAHADEDAERARILEALEACAGNQTRAAKMLGISRSTLVTKLAILRIPRPRGR